MSKESKTKSLANANETSTTENTARSKIGRNNEYVLNFLLSKGRYEADAIRVLLIAQRSNPNFDTLPFEDQTVLNRYLMDGLYKEDCQDVDAAKDYRQAKAAQLMKDIGPFFETNQQSLCVTVFLMKFASDSTMSTQTFSRLSARPIVIDATKELQNGDTSSENKKSEDAVNTSA